VQQSTELILENHAMPKSSFACRPVRQKEVAVIYQLEQEATGQNLGSLDDLRRFLEQPDNHCFVASRDGLRAGFVLFSVQAERERVAIIQTVELPGQKHHGARKFLLETLCRNTDQTGHVLGYAAPEADLPLHLLLKELNFLATRVVGSDYVFVFPRDKALLEKRDPRARADQPASWE
jgi:hypothetical protein